MAQLELIRRLARAKVLAEEAAQAKVLTEEEATILAEQGEEFAYYTTMLAERLGMELELVRRTCRELRDKRLFELKVVHNEDTGCPAGSAWCRTALGNSVLNELKKGAQL